MGTRQAGARHGSPWGSLLRNLLRTKPVDRIVAEGGHGEGGDLKRTMGLLQLTFFSVGATLGTGIFVILGEAVPLAGPAIVLSFVLAALTALFSALSYAELAGTIPVSGSSYSYTYATMGELVAWVCGWCLLLEYGVSVSAVAVGWGQYLNEFFAQTAGFTMPAAISYPPGGQEGGVINVPAVVVVLIATFLLLRGTSESATVNTVMVFLKIGVLVFFCLVAALAFRRGNLEPFAPLGAAGISAAGARVFFSYIGFDAASTAGEEARNPRRDLPLAIVLSLAIVTALYVLVGLTAVAAMHWSDFAEGGTEASLAVVLEVATGQGWPSVVLSLGAVIAIASVVLTVMYGQTRILFAMSRDGLIPEVFQKVNPRTAVPTANIVLVSLFIAVLAALVPLGRLADATSIGTLFAFALVNVGVMVLRRTKPAMPRSFRTPLFPFTPLLGVVFCVYLMIRLNAITWVVFALWTLVGLLVYFAYGYRRSHLAHAGAHRGSGRGLIETAEREGADLIVIGSAPGGPAGRIVVGSTADQLLHGSPVPVLMAPRGYAAGPPARLSGLTVAHRPSRGSELGLAAALRLARRLDVPIRLLTLLERPSWLSGVLRGEEIMRRQREYAVRDLQAAAELLSGHAQVTTQVAEGDGIEGAVRNCHWPPGELLACMSGSHGPLRQVFLGGVSGKIVRAAPCPVALLPGTAGRAGGAA